METSDRTQPDTTPPNRRWSGASMAAVGGAVVIGIAGLVALVGGGAMDEPNASTDSPTTTAAQTSTTIAPTTTTTAPSTTTTEAATTTAVAAELFPGLPEPVDELVPGGYAVRTEPIPFSFVVPDSGTDLSAEAAWVNQPEMPGPGIFAFPTSATSGGLIAGSLLFVMTRVGDDAETVVADLTAEIPLSEPAETAVGGQPAIQLEVDGSVGDRPVSSLSGEGVDVNLLGEIFRYRLKVVDTPNGTLVVLLEVAEEEVDTLYPYWEEIVDTIEFAP